jgi:vacuolar-type H+-ATPase subunit E/Vma4
MAAIAGRGDAEEERLRADAQELREHVRREHELQRELLCSDRQRTLIAAATRQAALIRLRAEHALALRLHDRARLCLKQLHTGDAEQLFRSLADELPVESWHTVRTSPVDAALASNLFSGATIIPDDSLSGGLKAATADNGLTIDNSLETRLERAWPDLLLHLMAELRVRTRCAALKGG